MTWAHRAWTGWLVSLAEAICHGERSGVVSLKPFSVPVPYIASGCRIGRVMNVLDPSCSVIGEQVVRLNENGEPGSLPVGQARQR